MDYYREKILLYGKIGNIFKESKNKEKYYTKPVPNNIRILTY
jgi:hypothetical protein